MYLKCAFLLVCLVAYSNAAQVIYFDDDNVEPTLVRHVRSPGSGSVDLNYKQDQSGKSASVQYNHNLYKSNDGRFNVDAYGYGSRNFDQNRNDYGGGIQGKYNFDG